MNVLSNSSVASMSEGCAFWEVSSCLVQIQLLIHGWDLIKMEDTAMSGITFWLWWAGLKLEREAKFYYIQFFLSSFIYFFSLPSILALFSGQLANPWVPLMLLLGWTLKVYFWTQPPLNAPILLAQGLYLFLEYPKGNPITFLPFTWPNDCLKVPNFAASFF